MHHIPNMMSRCIVFRILYVFSNNFLRISQIYTTEQYLLNFCYINKKKNNLLQYDSGETENKVPQIKILKDNILTNIS